MMSTTHPPGAGWKGLPMQGQADPSSW